MVNGFDENVDIRAGARGDYAQPAPVVLELKGSAGAYSNSSFNFSLPSRSTILSASVDLEGLPVVIPGQSHTCDFGQPDASNHFAYKGSSGQNGPGNSKPATFSGTQVPSGDLSLMSTSDNRYAVSSVFGYPSPYGYHMFKFKVPFNTLAKATVTWEGFAGESFSGVGTATVYVWNTTQAAWETVGTGSASPDSTIAKDFYGQGYIDGDGYLYVLVFCTVGVNFYGELVNSVSTDYVKAEVQGGSEVYAKNPSMDIGANGTIEWGLITDRYDTCVTVSGAGIVSELQHLVEVGKTQFVDIKVKFSAETEGRINVSNFNVTYNAPPWCTGIPSTYKFEEDTVALKLINLDDYFNDPDDLGVSKLIYKVSYQQDPGKLDAEVDVDGHSLGFKPSKNWYGALDFQVTAFDLDGLSRVSNTFTVTVTPVNDPPILEPIANQTAPQDVPWRLKVNASDADTTLDQWEEITFADNTTLFDMNPLTGEILFTPMQNQVGTYRIQITATDKAGTSDTGDFTLEIKDVEDPPVLMPIPNQNATAGKPFTYATQASDPDIPYGDSLRFSDDCPIFEIDPASGFIWFTPGINDTGTYNVTITVNDTRGGSDSQRFILVVLNPEGSMNHPPSIDPVPELTVNENVLLEYTVNASDPDLGIGDSLTFSDDCPLFNINSSNGRISFTPARRDAGTYNVTITVKDVEGLSDSTRFHLTVVHINHPPEILSVLPGSGTKVQTNRYFNLSVSASDPDGDQLDIVWMDGVMVLGRGATIPTSFSSSGIRVLAVTVSDGQYQVTREISIQVEKPAPQAPRTITVGFDTMNIPLLLMVICVIGLVLVLGYRLVRGSPGRPGR